VLVLVLVPAVYSYIEHRTSSKNININMWHMQHASKSAGVFFDHAQ
jgi:hypothetical protein